MIKRDPHAKKQVRHGDKRPLDALPVHVTPLDANLQPKGHGFMANTQDVSARGIVLIHYRKVHAPFLAVELPDAVEGRSPSMVQVLRCRAVGPYFEIVGRFVAQMIDASERQAASHSQSPQEAGCNRIEPAILGDLYQCREP
jgi:hypothetical protein